MPNMPLPQDPECLSDTGAGVPLPGILRHAQFIRINMRYSPYHLSSLTAEVAAERSAKSAQGSGFSFASQTSELPPERKIEMYLDRFELDPSAAYDRLHSIRTAPWTLPEELRIAHARGAHRARAQAERAALIRARIAARQQEQMARLGELTEMERSGANLDGTLWHTRACTRTHAHARTHARRTPWPPTTHAPATLPPASLDLDVGSEEEEVDENGDPIVEEEEDDDDEDNDYVEDYGDFEDGADDFDDYNDGGDGALLPAGKTRGHAASASPEGACPTGHSPNDPLLTTVTAPCMDVCHRWRCLLTRACVRSRRAPYPKAIHQHPSLEILCAARCASVPRHAPLCVSLSVPSPGALRTACVPEEGRHRRPSWRARATPLAGADRSAVSRWPFWSTGVSPLCA